MQEIWIADDYKSIRSTNNVMLMSFFKIGTESVESFQKATKEIIFALSICDQEGLYIGWNENLLKNFFERVMTQLQG